MNTIKILFLIILLTLAVFVVLPAGALIFGSVWSALPGKPGHFTLQHWFEVINLTIPATLYTQFVNTLIYGAASAGISVFLGVVMSYFVAKTKIPFKRYFENLILIPRAFPLIVAAVAWSLLAAPRVGLFNTILHTSIFNIYSMDGMIWLFLLYEVPTVFLISLSAHRLVDPSLEEQASVCGSSKLRMFFGIRMSLLRPLVLSLCILMFILSIVIIDIPILIGGPANTYTLAGAVYWFVSGETMLEPNYNAAAALSGIILVITISLLFVYRKSLRDAERYATVTSRGFRGGEDSALFDIGKWRYLVAGCFLAFFVIAIVLPGIITFLLSFTQYFVRPGVQSLSILTLKHWIAVFQISSFQRGLRDSLILAAGGSTVLIFLAILVSYLSYRSLKGLSRSLVENLSMLPLSFPGVVFAIAYLWLFTRTPMYDTLWIIFFYYIFAYLPLTLRILAPYMFQLNKETEEASWVSGAGKIQTIFRIIAPLLKTGLIASWVLIFQALLTEFAGSIILYSFGTETLSTVLYSLGLQQGNLAYAAVIGSLILILSLGSYATITRLSKISF